MVSAVADVEAVVRVGEEDFVLRSEDRLEWATHITDMLTSPDCLRRMGARARCRVLERTSTDSVLDRYAKSFRHIARPRA